MNFTEGNTVEQMILDTVAQLGGGVGQWEFVPAAQVPRRSDEVLVESWVREALIRLNPEIAAQPERADEVLYRLRAILLAMQPAEAVEKLIDTVLERGAPDNVSIILVKAA